MSTAPSSTSAPLHRPRRRRFEAPSPTREVRRAVADLPPLLSFRLSGLRGRSRLAAPIALTVIALLTVLAAVVPATLREFAELTRADARILLPSAFVGVLVIAIVSAASSGGGRELLARESAVAFPVSPTTDHLGALVMAPLNIAWLLQGWAVIGLTSYAVGARPTLPAALVPVLLWLVAATAMAQLLAWVVEWLRRGPQGRLVVRGLAVSLALLGFGVIGTDRLTGLLDRSPTLAIALGVLDAQEGRWTEWLRVVLQLTALASLAVAVGAWLNGRVARRAPRDELRVESSHHVLKGHPGSDLQAVARIDRAGIWRSVPMRRGLVVLALFPGLVALGGGLTWDMLGIFPGLVASGGALLFGVNAWCLDGRGALWRDSLPVSPRLTFAARALVLAEILLVATVVTLVLASARAGVPTLSQLVAVVCATVVVTVQVVATALRWSVRRPFAVDLRSSRATPAPPLVMVGYSARLALSTTFTGLLFNTAATGPWWVAPVLAVPFLLWSGVKLARTAGSWTHADVRARVVATVAS